MRVLVATAMYPSQERPAWGAFVRTQVQSLESSGVDVEVDVLGGRRRKLAYLAGAARINRRAAHDGFDLVHAHYGYVGMIGRIQRALPLVVTFHGDDLLGTVRDDGSKGAVSRVTVAAGRALCRVADEVIVQSREMAVAAHRPDVHVIPHEVDLDTFRPTPRDEARQLLGLEPGRRYVLFAADPAIPVKRFPLATAAMARLRRDQPEIELLVIHTETQERLALHMSAADALVFPSFQEGSPNIVKQAMACNLPVVATPVGDVCELIGATDGCHVCRPDAEAIAAALADVLERGGRTRGREAVGHLSSHAIARRVIGVYERALAGGRRRRGQ